MLMSTKLHSLLVRLIEGMLLPVKRQLHSIFISEMFTKFKFIKIGCGLQIKLEKKTYLKFMISSTPHT